MGESVHWVDGCRPLSRAQTYFVFVILGLRSPSLAPPQALCLRPLRGLRARLLRRLIKIFAVAG